MKKIFIFIVMFNFLFGNENDLKNILENQEKIKEYYYNQTQQIYDFELINKEFKKHNVKQEEINEVISTLKTCYFLKNVSVVTFNSEVNEIITGQRLECELYLEKFEFFKK
ncbi:hypothetical protein [Aliarcobacter butzleri]|uniref:hypothetical protein n=1 Tax=Aliarcobacter butzleri TaxID=28197 RepID=UPI000F483D00|nr:hypothetical protein [Aliarcobacter butzleri]